MTSRMSPERRAVLCLLFVFALGCCWYAVFRPDLHQKVMHQPDLQQKIDGIPSVGSFAEVKAGAWYYSHMEEEAGREGWVITEKDILEHLRLAAKATNEKDKNLHVSMALLTFTIATHLDKQELAKGLASLPPEIEESFMRQLSKRVEEVKKKSEEIKKP